MLQPKVKELQKKYGHDRERLAQETMELYKDAGTNPFASCLPILLQMPIFFALFRLLDQAAKNKAAHGVLTVTQGDAVRRRRALRGEDLLTFLTADGDRGVQVMALVLVLAMTATTFLTQRQLMSKNMPETRSPPYAQQQKMLLYVLPVVFAVGGVAFPIGVLIYWTTSNLWTMGQQFYVIRRNPAPEHPAAGQGGARRREGAARAPRDRPPRRGVGSADGARRSSSRRRSRAQPKKQTAQPAAEEAHPSNKRP